MGKVIFDKMESLNMNKENLVLISAKAKSKKQNKNKLSE